MVLPVHDENPLRRTPWLTYGLVAANVGVLLITPLTAGTCELEAFYHRWAAIPTELLANQQLAIVPTATCAVGPPGYSKIPALSVLFSMFLHGGWLHLIGNLIFLWIFGNNIEDRLGHLRFLLFYLSAGYVAAYGFAFAEPDLAVPYVGASGAVSGLLGAYLVLYPRVRVWTVVPLLLFLPLRLPAWVVLGSWFVLQAVFSAGYAISGGGEVAYLAHVIGFVFGLLVALPLRPRTRRPPPPQNALIYRKDWS